MKIMLPWPSPKLSPNKRLHWAQKAKAVQSSRNQTILHCIEQSIKPMNCERVNVTITFHPPDKRRRDFDNIVATAKSLIDGVADSIRVDDFNWEMTLKRGAICKGGAVIFEIEENLK